MTSDTPADRRGNRCRGLLSRLRGGGPPRGAGRAGGSAPRPGCSPRWSSPAASTPRSRRALSAAGHADSCPPPRRRASSSTTQLHHLPRPQRAGRRRPRPQPDRRRLGLGGVPGQHRPHAAGPPGGAGRAEAAASSTRPRPGRSAQYIQELGGGPQLPDGRRTCGEGGDAGPGWRAVPGELLVVPRLRRRRWRAVVRQVRPELATVTRPASIYAAMLTGPQNMPVFGDNQLTPEEKRDIIAYVQEPCRPSKTRVAGHLGRYGPVHRRSGHLPGRDRRRWSSPPLDCGEVMSATHGSRSQQIERRRPAADPVRHRPEGARRDGIEIVHYEPRFPSREPRPSGGSSRTVTALFLLAGLSATAFVVAYIWWPWQVTIESGGLDKLYTPLLGLTLGLALLVHRLRRSSPGARSCCPREVAIQERHDGPSQRGRPALHRATRMAYMADEMGVKRRPLLGGSLVAGLAPLGVAAAAPLVGGLITEPAQEQPDVPHRLGADHRRERRQKPVRLTREDGTPIRPEDVSVGGQMTVFPGIPGGRHQRVRRLAHAADPPAGR